MKESAASNTTITDLWTAAIDPSQGLNDSDLYVEQQQYSSDQQHPLGPQHDALYIVIPISIIYLLILITGLVGNISTCIVITRNKSMQTATNYYLFSLAISDLLLLLSGLPAEVYLVWYKYPYIFSESFCIFRGMAAETSSNASVLTITAFTVERYLAICHPFLSHTMSKLPRVVKLNLSIWLVSLSCAIPQALQFGLIQYSNDPKHVICTLKTVIIQHSFEISTVIFFVLPMTLIIILYALIGLKLRRSNKMNRYLKTSSNSPTDAKITKQSKQGRNSKRVLKMLVAVVVAFFICWAPFHVQRLIAIYGYSTNQTSSFIIRFLYNVFTYVSGVLYYVSTTINPILYNIMSNKFREAFKDTFVKSCKMRVFTAKRQQRTYLSFSRSQQQSMYFGSRTAGLSNAAGPAHDYSSKSAQEDSLHGTTSRSGQNETETSTYEATNRKQSLSSSSRKSISNQAYDNSSTSGQSSNNIFLQRPDKQSDRRSSENSHPIEHRSGLQNSTLTMRPIIVTDRRSVKKWWQIWNLLPGVKALKLDRHSRDESSVLETNQEEEMAISMSTFSEHPRPV